MGIVSLKDYRWDGSKKLELKDAETGAPEFVDKKTLKAQTMENLAEAAALQDKLYAQGREGILIAIQARDAAGKDSLIKKVFGQLNPASRRSKRPARKNSAMIISGASSAPFRRAGKSA